MPAVGNAIEVSELHKTFRVPRHRVHTLKERALHPFRKSQFDEFHVLRGLEFEIHDGEFFGIVGRNGSGKSTLLKCLAGIYKADSGSIRIKGRLAPFIELGVGFNPDLTARDNVIINAVMMGLTPREARRRINDIIHFAELDRFVEMKLKNYSSGMQVRLAFSVMVQSDADVLLIDEVLAVGDAAFQQKCIDVFYRLRDEGKTIVLVTHVMGLVEQFCHRAMMISGGHITQIGDPAAVGRAYISENFAGPAAAAFDPGDEDGKGQPVRINDAWVTDEAGSRVDAIEHGRRMNLHVEIEALEPIAEPGIAMWLTNQDHVRVFTAGARENDEALSDLAAGERIEFTVNAENPLSDGRYYVGCSVTRGSAGLEILMFRERVTDLLSFGRALNGIVAIDHEGSVRRSKDRAVA
jgi:ABC-type polysaccharide/polyol phosphate transport system ATPase subunit